MSSFIDDYSQQERGHLFNDSLSHPNSLTRQEAEKGAGGVGKEGKQELRVRETGTCGKERTRRKGQREGKYSVGKQDMDAFNIGNMEEEKQRLVQS